MGPPAGSVMAIRPFFGAGNGLTSSAATSPSRARPLALQRGLKTPASPSSSICSPLLMEAGLFFAAPSSRRKPSTNFPRPSPSHRNSAGFSRRHPASARTRTESLLAMGGDPPAKTARFGGVIGFHHSRAKISGTTTGPKFFGMQGPTSSASKRSQPRPKPSPAKPEFQMLPPPARPRHGPPQSIVIPRPLPPSIYLKLRVQFSSSGQLTQAVSCFSFFTLPPPPGPPACNRRRSG